jgi:prepilin-type N-terminal cleavage/methylation domain-containing protein
MKRGLRRRQHGVTLVELLLGLAVTALLLAPLVPMLQTAAAAARIGGEQAALEQEADFAIERISDRIRATPPSTQLSSNSDDWLTPAAYLVIDGTLYERQKGINYPLAVSVIDFGMTAPASISGRPVIQVSLTLKRGDFSASAGATVRMGEVQ